MNEEQHLGNRCSPWRPRASPLVGACLLVLIVVIATGCSGINAGGSVSPLDFFLPGLLQNRPASPVIPAETNSVPLLAQATPVPF